MRGVLSEERHFQANRLRAIVRESNGSEWNKLRGGRGFAVRYVNSSGLHDLIRSSTRIVDLDVSGMMMPLEVFSSAATRLTRIRSWSGRIFIELSPCGVLGRGRS